MITRIGTKIEKGRMYATITRDTIEEGQRISVDVAGNTFYKYLPNAGEVVDIDITPYCESSLRPIGDAIKALPGNSVAQGVAQGVAVAPLVEQQGGDVIYWRNVRGKDNVALTRMPYLQMSEGDSIFFALLVADDYREVLSCGGVELSIQGNGRGEDICVVRIQPTSKASTLSVTNTFGYGGVSIPICIVPRGINTRRLVWLNEVGGIDSWNFEFLRESTFATASDVFYSATKGYTRTNRISERAHVVETRELDDITASVVAYVIASPEVYLEENGTLIPIDIITEECRTYSDTELSSIQVAYRLKERERV